MKKGLRRIMAASLTISMVICNGPAAEIMAAPKKTADTVTFPNVYPDSAIIKLSGEELENTVTALLNTMTVEEKYSFLGGNGTGDEGNAGYLDGVPRLGVPQSKMYDGPAGVLSLYDTTNPPQEQMLAATWDTELAYKYGEIHGAENNAIGGNMQLGSQFDIMRSPYFGRAKDQMGEDPYLLSTLSAPLTEGIQDQNVIAVGKHFAAFSLDASPGTKTNVDVSEQALHETHLPGFESAVLEGGLLGMMSAYNAINGTYASAHSYLQNEVLRGMWGFSGFTITDWGGNDGNTIAAGTDIEMPSLKNNSQEECEKLIAEGKLTQEQVDASVEHVLTALGKAGYLGLVQIGEDGLAKEEPGRTEIIKLKVDLDELEKVRVKSNKSALEIAEKGGVLLKNEESTLPLKTGNTTAVIGLAGMRLKSGVGGERSSGTISEMTSPYEALSELLGKKNVEGQVALDSVGTIIPNKYLYTATASNAEKATLSNAKKATSSNAEKSKKSKATSSNAQKENHTCATTSNADKASQSESSRKGADRFAEENTAIDGLLHGVIRTYGVAKEEGNDEEFQGQWRPSGSVSATEMEGHETGTYAATDKEINFTVGTIDGKPNKYYLAKFADEGTANSFTKASGSAYTWTTYLKAPEDGEYSIIFGGIGGEAAATIQTGTDAEGNKITTSLGISNINQGTQWATDTCGDTGTILSSADVTLEAGKFYEIVVKGVATLEEKDLQITLSWITPSQRVENYENAIKAAEKNDTSVVFAYNTADGLAKTREDCTLALPEEQEQLILDVAEAAHENGHRVVVVLNNSTPVTMGNWLDEVDAVLEMYYPGQKGGVATANLLTGKVNPSGKLAFTIPKDDLETLDTYTEEIFETQQVQNSTVDYYEGILTGYKWYDANEIEPLYDFGYGLSYTDFAYSDLKVTEKRENGEKAGFDVSFKVKNTGDVKGAEVAQVYLGEAEVPDGVQMAKYALAGYYRTPELKPGEEKEVTVHINERSLSFWNTDGELQDQSDGTIGKWKVAEGTRIIYVGAASDNLLLEQKVEVKSANSNSSDNSNNSNNSGNSGNSAVGSGSVTGSWKQDMNGWWYSYTKGGYASGKWEKIQNKWYYFNEKGYAVTGWQLINSNWYYFDTTNCDMMTGWLQCAEDNYWYYLNSEGAMVTGWQEINKKWYYFNSSTANQATYTFNGENGTWMYSNDSIIPYGAMYENRETPDGHYVNSNGEKVN